MSASINIVIPVKNEQEGLSELLPRLCELYSASSIIVVNDGSTDNTEAVAKAHGVQLISHSYSRGNGAAIKSGARHSNADILVFMDGDGQHNPDDIAGLVSVYEAGNDMVVGARGRESQAGFFRYMANSFYNKFSSWMVGQRVVDLTSGFRVVNAKKFKEFLYLLPNGFSYPTTITMAFFRTGYSVCYRKCNVRDRSGKSHISGITDGIKFLLIIFKVGVLYSPIKIFAPSSAVLMIVGLIYYGVTFITEGRFTNMSALLLTSSMVVFLMGLLSEQINNLSYAIMSQDGTDIEKD